MTLIEMVMSRTLENIGVIVDSPIQCDCCRQRFRDQETLDLHQYFVHKLNKEDQRAQPANVTGEGEDLQSQLKDCVSLDFH